METRVKGIKEGLNGKETKATNSDYLLGISSCERKDRTKAAGSWTHFFPTLRRVILSLKTEGHGPIARQENECSWEQMVQQLTRDEMFEEHSSQIPY